MITVDRGHWSLALCPAHLFSFCHPFFASAPLKVYYSHIGLTSNLAKSFFTGQSFPSPPSFQENQRGQALAAVVVGRKGSSKWIVIYMMLTLMRLSMVRWVSYVSYVFTKTDFAILYSSYYSHESHIQNQWTNMRLVTLCQPWSVFTSTLPFTPSLLHNLPPKLSRLNRTCWIFLFEGCG